MLMLPYRYHSPDEGVYHFDGNRDIDYLLTLCEEIGLFVLAAPGPYICAETQAGGIPQWVVAKRDVRIRHSVVTFFRSYDSKYSNHSAQWLSAILPILARHQITSRPSNGCLLALQLENENFEAVKGFPIGLHDEMRHLAKTARDLGMTVPFFTNDGWEAGSFIARPDSHRKFGKPTFGLDLYGFDKYVVFCPTSSPLAVITGGKHEKSTWGTWNPSTVEGALDRLESTVRGFGGGAAESPMFIPELQGGWFNHYTVGHSFDDVYDYYGETYTKLVLDSVLAQGTTALSFYMWYGGTNWGTLGDPDVYTSYDYSACIREHGYLSGRGRRMRLGLAFARSFADLLVRTNAMSPEESNVVVTPSRYLNRCRRSQGSQPLEFVFLRKFAEGKEAKIDIAWIDGETTKQVALTFDLMYKESFVAIANYVPLSGVRLILSAMPIHVRALIGNDEVWIVQCDSKANGQMAFAGEIKALGTLQPKVLRKDGASIVSFDETSGWATIEQSTGNGKLYIIALTGDDLYTLAPAFEEAHWARQSIIEDLGERNSTVPLAVAWGAHSIDYDLEHKRVTIETTERDTALYLFSPLIGNVSPPGFSAPRPDDPYSGLPFLHRRELSRTSDSATFQFTRPVVHSWETAVRDFGSMPWESIPLRSRSLTRPALDPIDLGFTSGHSLYRLTFLLSHVARDLILHLNIRHRVTFYLNDHAVGGHLTYSLATNAAGAKNGPDIGIRGGERRHTLPARYLKKGKNEIVILVESFGMNRQPFFVNDVRNPRGVLEAKVVGRGVGEVRWEVAGVDVRNLREVFAVSGFPGEDGGLEWAKLDSEEESTGGREEDGKLEPVKLVAKNGIPTWFRGRFNLPPNIATFHRTSSESTSPVLHVPLRVRMTGPATAYIYIGPGNGTQTMIGRYYGNGDAVQKDFYIPEGLLWEEDNVVKLVVYGREDGEWVGVSIEEWRVKDGWSGNRDEEGVRMVTVREVIPFGKEVE
ncbi:hypothetical protein HK104_000691 [Borealophlyctis nickersoniae]|nr:hypothetical protein HK104_000691 [Borealophlyctis nickersoniae]